jgi:hypothetical protein
MKIILKMRSIRPFGFLATLIIAWGISPAARANPGPAADGTIPVSIRNNSDFADLNVQLQAMANVMGFHTTNSFCVVGYEAMDDPDHIVVPYIYWPTQNKIIILGFGSNKILSTTDYFDLKRDILPDGEVTSGYLHQSEVKSVIQDCHKNGDSYTIRKTAGGWVTVNKFPQFSSIKVQLQYLVDHRAIHKTNNFCAIGQKDGSFLGVFVYWETSNQLIFWLPSPYDKYDPFAVNDAPIQIDLKHGLRDQEDAEDNRNEMQQSYAETILQACARSGQNFVINKSY